MTRPLQLRPAFWHFVVLLFAATVTQAQAQVQISEFMALNQFTTFRDEDGERSDWIELTNEGAEAVSLNGWYLSDDAGDLRRWQFPVSAPAVTLQPGGRLVVFASDKNRKTRADRLHTNFRLSFASGGFLALVRPDGLTIEHSYTSYPQQIQDVSYGLPSTPRETLVPQGYQGRARVPVNADEMISGWNSAATFDDSTWQAGQTGFGYDTTDSYGALIGTGGDLEGPMYNVSPSALVRIVFDVADPAAVTALRLQMKYDDGFVAYLNGTEIARVNAPENPVFDSGATADRNGDLVQNYEAIDLPTAHQALVPGGNVLAFHLLNHGNGSTQDTDSEGLPNGSRALLLPLLEATLQPQPSYLLTATPNAVNSAARTNVGPLISDTTNAPARPLGNASSPPILITSKVTPSLRDIGSVTLRYRVMYGAEVALPMIDDGTNGDVAAADGVFSALMPTTAVPAGQMLRWRVVAVDVNGSSSTEPRFLNSQDNDQYFGTVGTESETANSQVPVMHWFVQNPSASQQEGGTRCSLFFLGRFYDNVAVNLHGQSSAGFSVAKKSHDFNFSKDNRFLWREGEEEQRAINLITTWADKSRVRDTMAWESWSRAGHIASHWSQLVRVQQNGQFWGVYDMVENGDEDFLDRALDQNGALYKIYNSLESTSGNEKKSREFEGMADLQALITGLNPGAPLATRRRYAYDNVNIAALVNYLANNVLIINNDFGHKNYYVYRDTEGTGEWSVLPWDQDLSLGHTWTGSQNYFNDDIHSQAGLVIGAAPGNRLMNLIMNSSSSTVAPEMARMFLRRLRTLMDTQLGPPGSTDSPIAQRINELVDSIDPPDADYLTDADLDLRKWGYWLDGGGNALSQNNNFDAATHEHGARRQAARIVDSNPSPPYPASASNAEGLGDTRPAFLVGRRTRLFNLNPTLIGLPIPPSQPAIPPGLTIEQVEANPASGEGEQEYFVIKNSSNQAIDISGWTLTGEVNHTFIGGTVIPPGGGATENIGLLHMVRNAKAFRARTAGPKAGEYRYVVEYDGRLSARGGLIELRNTGGSIVTSLTYPGAPTALQESLRVTELNYAPKTPSASEAAALPGIQASDFEFIELLNTSAAPLNIGGAHFDRGITFAFPADYILAPGQRTVVAASAAAFTTRYGAGASIAGQFEGNLNNAGEEIRLLDRSGEMVVRFTYSPTWHPAATGGGFTLVAAAAIPAFDSYDAAEGWRVSVREGGSPGAAEPALVTAPLPGSLTNTSITLEFTLPTTALPGSLSVNFDDGEIARPMVLSASQEGQGQHSITFDPANPTANPAIASGEPLPDGTYLVIVTYRDVAENPATSSAPGPGVTLDRAGPAITVPANLVVEATGPSGADVVYEAASAVDPSDVTSLTYSKESGTVFPLGATEVIVTATDAAANIATANFTVTVQDTTAPQIGHSPVARIADAGPGGTAVLPDLTSELVATDLVGIVSVTQSPAAGTLLAVGQHVVSFTVEDEAGNTSTTTSNFDVRLVFAEGATVVAATGTPAPGAGTPGGPPAGSTLASFGSPAVSDLRHVAARALLQYGRRKLASIYRVDAAGGAELLAFKGSAAPGVAGATFKAVGDPIMSPSGAVAFVGRISGSGATPKSDDGVWTTALTTELSLALREGSTVPGLAGPVVNTISSISLRDGELLALLSFRSGIGGVSRANDAALVRLTAEGVTILLREGDSLAAVPGALAKSLTVLSPAPGSPGHGRWHGDGTVLAKVTLTDQRDVVVAIAADGSMTALSHSGEAASSETGSAAWARLWRPAMDPDGAHFVLGGTLARLVGVTKANDSALTMGTATGGFSLLAREGAAAPGSGNAVFASFAEPLVNDDGHVLFAAALKGIGVTKANSGGIWFGPADDLRVLARLGSATTDRDGNVIGTQQWARFISHALASGPAGGPILLARIKGSGVTAKTNVGLWALDSAGTLRQLLRTGDAMPIGGASKTLAGITLLDAPRAVFGTTRSFNATGALAVRATFSDKSQALLRVEIP